MGRNDLCFCGSGKKQKKCHPDIHEQSLAAKCLSLYGKIESIIKNYYNSGQQTPPCKKGCSDCCYNYFVISNIEFKIICKELQNWNKKQINKLVSATYKQM